MKRMKKLALAVVMAMALAGIVGAANASAARFSAVATPTTISSPTETKHEWIFHTNQQYCPRNPIEGAITNSPWPLLQASAKDVSCTNLLTGQVMAMNGCEFTYFPGAQAQGGTFKGTVSIGPAGCGPISFTGTSKSACTVTVPAQKQIAATYRNVTGGDVEVAVSGSGLLHTQVSGLYCGALGTFSDGVWVGSWTLAGSSSGSPVNIAVEPSGGIELPAPEGIAIAGEPPKLAAGIYPMTITGKESTENPLIWESPTGNVGCNSVALSTSVNFETTQFSVTPKYSECWGYGMTATVSMNGCTYAFSVLDQAPEGSTYAGHSDIACPEGKAMTITIILSGKTKCTVTIPAQTTDSEGLSFTNEAAYTIGLGMEVDGVDYHQQKGEGLGACNTKDSTGTFVGSTALVGSY